HGGEELQARRVNGRLPERDERVAAQHLAVQNADAVEPCRLHASNERHQVGHRRGAGNPEMHADGCGHDVLLTGPATSRAKRRTNAVGSGTKPVITNWWAPAAMARRICPTQSSGVPAPAQRSRRNAVSPQRSVRSALSPAASSW